MPDKSTGDAFRMLAQSRKFWVMVLDVLISLVLYFVTKYAGGYLDDVKYVILALQPVVWVVIFAIAKDNTTEAMARAAQAAIAARPPGTEE